MVFSYKTIFLFVTILLSALFVWPELNYISMLSQGDHGCFLYASDAVTHGKLPYRDFWWIYGPIMPYYYGLFFKLFGVHLTSVLLGRAFLFVICSVFFYLSMACFMPPWMAFLGAGWFTLSYQDFSFTFNHIGGIAAELVLCWCILSYVRNGSMCYLWTALAADFILGLVKIDFGFAGLVTLVLGVLGVDFLKKGLLSIQKKNFYWTATVLVPLCWGTIYWSLLHSLPQYALLQCMPFLGGYEQWHTLPLDSIRAFLIRQRQDFFNSPLSVAAGIVLHACTLVSAYLLISKKIDKTYRRDILLALAILGVFSILFSGEYIPSGVWYDTFWFRPFLVMFHCIMIALVFALIVRFLRIFLFIFLGGVIVFGVVTHINSIQSQKDPDHFLSMDRGQIYVGNELRWIDTVTQVTNFSKTNLKKDDLFFAFPYDGLYYYLTGKEAPTRQLIFFNYINIPMEQEIAIIRELEEHHVNYVFMSNRFKSDETGLGQFGKTYCPLLAQYIFDNFAPVTFIGGNWSQHPGWASNHGIAILKRKSS